MRILLVSHPPLSAEIGAGQTALQLAAALRERGHDALAWSPEPLPVDTKAWNLWRRQTAAIERFAAHNGPFDVIETPAISASRKLARCGRLVVRSVQPELRYLFLEIRGDLSRRPSPRAVANALLGVPRAAAILGGWRRARFILCLGHHELAWMRRRFPGWSHKLGVYRSAPTPGERATLLNVRRGRRSPGVRQGLRFLWMGRWTAQKGVRRLVRFLRERIAVSPHDTFTLAGTGPYAESNLPAELLRCGRVRLVPSFSRAELPALLAAHDAGLFTSDAEGWGLSLHEMLESGMTVFATEAGAVADLRPFFPTSLRPFPPPRDPVLSPPEDLEANGYFAEISWPAIAGAYERQVLTP